MSAVNVREVAVSQSGVYGDTTELTGGQFSQGTVAAQKSGHAEFYHRNHVSAVKKARWSDEEMVLVAREDIRLEEAGVSKPSIDLFGRFRGRTADAIKCMRRSEKYKTLRERFSLPGAAGATRKR